MIRGPIALRTSYCQGRTDVSPDEYLPFIKSTYIRDIQQNGIPVKHFPNNGTVTYRFRDSDYTFDIRSLAILDVLEYPYGDYKYPPDWPVMQVSNLARARVLIPCLKDGKPDLFDAQHRAATDLCTIWYREHFKYIDIMNNLAEFIWTYKFTDLNEEECEAFSVLLYGTINYTCSARIKL